MTSKSSFKTTVPSSKVEKDSVILTPREISSEYTWDSESSNSTWSYVDDEDFYLTKKMAFGNGNFVAIKNDGSLWGWSFDGGYGNCFLYSARLFNTNVFGIGCNPLHFKISDSCDWKHVSAGTNHFTGIKNDNSMWAWGSRYGYAIGCYAEFPVLNFTFIASPVQIMAEANNSWKSVKSTGQFNIALKCDGTIWSWGCGLHGDGNAITARARPIQYTGAPPTEIPSANTEAITNTMLGRASLTLDDTIDYTGDYDYPDSGFWDITLPWSVTLGPNNHDRVIVSTDSYLLFSSTSNTDPFFGTDEDYDFDPAMFNLPKLYIGADDRAANRIYYGIEGVSPSRTFRIRYEGYLSYSSPYEPESPTRAWEVIFYEDTPSKIDIQIDPGVDLEDGSTFSVDSNTVRYINISSRGFRINSVSSVVISEPVPNFKYVTATQESFKYIGSAISTEGKLYTWGTNCDGVLGTNQSPSTLNCRLVALQVGEDTNWKATFISPSRTTSDKSTQAAIKNDGTLWVWGSNYLYNLGDGTSISKSSPVQTVTGGTDWKTAATSLSTNKAIKNDGTMWAWGRNIYGNLGYCDCGPLLKRDSKSIATSPILVESATGKNWKDVIVSSCSCNLTLNSNLGYTKPFFQGESINFAVTDEGKLYSWGRNCRGVLGHPTNYNNCFIDYCNYNCLQITCLSGGWANSNLFDAYDVPIKKTAVAFNQNFSGDLRYTLAAIKNDGTLWTWGSTCGNATGDNSTIPFLSSPVQTLTGGSDWQRLSGTCRSFVAIKCDGTLWLWGQRCCELGSYNSPTQIFTDQTWCQAEVASQGRMALIRSDGTLWTTGHASMGFRGNDQSAPGSTSPSSPVQTIAGGTNWRNLSAASCCVVSMNYNVYGTVLAVKTDGTLWGWGANRMNALGDSTTICRSSPVQTSTGGTNWKQAQVSHGRAGSTAVGIKTDGTLWGWGRGNYAITGCSYAACPMQTTSLAGTSWRSVFVSSDPSGARYAISCDGEHWVWGYSIGGFPNSTDARCFSSPYCRIAGCIPYPPRRVVKIGGSRNGWTQASNSMALKTDGSLWVWGCNESQRLGIACTGPVTLFANNTPEESTDLCDLSEIFVSKEQFSRSGLWGVGWSNYQGRFGIGCTDSICVLTQLDPSFCWNSISGYYRSAAAIKCDGSLWTWGCNFTGKLGVNDGTNVRKEFTQVGTTCNWSKVTMGSYHAFAIKCDGTLWSWGDCRGGRTGLNANTIVYSPTQIGDQCWIDVSSEWWGGSAIRDDGTLWMWGDGWGGRLGTDNIIIQSSPVQTVAGGTNWCAVSARGGNRAAIKTDGTMWLTGWNFYGQLGGNFTTTGGGISSPIQTVGGGTNWKQVNGYYAKINAIKTDGTLWSMGRNNVGQLGTGDYYHRSSPTQTVTGGTNWRCVFEGNCNTFAIKNDGTLWGWGINTNNLAYNYRVFGACFNCLNVPSPIQMDNGIKGFWKNGSGGMYNTFIGIFESEADDL